MSNLIDLDDLRAKLVAMDSAIISGLLLRAQSKTNFQAYNLDSKGDFVKKLLEIESGEAEAGRFNLPHTIPYHSHLITPGDRFQESVADVLCVPAATPVDLSKLIVSDYLVVLDGICMSGVDSTHSYLETDCTVYMEISKRIHFAALYVAESKFRKNTGGYTDVVTKCKAALEGRDFSYADMDAQNEVWECVKPLIDLLRDETQEENVLRRVIESTKALQAGNEFKVKVNPREIGSFFTESIIPLTIFGEVLYLLERPKYSGS
ncbi:MAG: hypothetical protein QF632_06720 [Candidatus Woesearchaeota archaeon]|jgi:chorismate mutase|nr:hypothetical protein [Candidatus Woesearchaeota archaeon]MDP7458570.1 hypothetical protein [Candidatus Woesearchaeota archaeon]